MVDCDWDLTGDRLAGFRFADWLTDSGLGDSSEPQECEGGVQRGWDVAQAYGWVRTVRFGKNDGCHPDRHRHRPRGFSFGSDYPELTNDGRKRVSEVRALRGDPAARVRGCRQALLLWLAYEDEDPGSAELMVSRDEKRFYDTPFTAREANAAAKFLHGAGLITGWNYPLGDPSSEPSFMTPKLSTQGRLCVELANGDVGEFLNPPAQKHATGNTYFTQIYNGDVTGQVGQGPNVTQIQSNRIDPNTS